MINNYLCIFILSSIIYGISFADIDPDWDLQITGNGLEKLGNGMYNIKASGKLDLVCKVIGQYHTIDVINATYTWSVDNHPVNDSWQRIETDPKFERRYEVIKKGHPFNSILRIINQYGFRAPKHYEQINCVIKTMNNFSITKSIQLIYTPGDSSIFLSHRKTFDYAHPLADENSAIDMNRVTVKAEYGKQARMNCLVDKTLVSEIANGTQWGIRWFTPYYPDMEEINLHAGYYPDDKYDKYFEIEELTVRNTHTLSLIIPKFAPYYYSDYMCRVFVNDTPISELLFHVYDEFKCFEETRKCYALTLLRGTYDAISNYCQEKNATVASIHSKRENDILTEIASSALPPQGLDTTTTWVYIGLRRNMSETSSFYWADNSNFDYSNWQDGNPDDTTAEYVALNSKVGCGRPYDEKSFQIGKWDDFHAKWGTYANIPIRGVCQYSMDDLFEKYRIIV